MKLEFSKNTRIWNLNFRKILEYETWIFEKYSNMKLEFSKNTRIWNFNLRKILEYEIWIFEKYSNMKLEFSKNTRIWTFMKKTCSGSRVIPRWKTERHDEFVILRTCLKRVSVGQPERERPLWRLRPRLKYTIKIDLKEIWWENVGWIIADNRYEWRAAVNTVMNFRLP